ncbi:MAG: acetyltransferase [Gemmatimonadaceae bacterium]|nr:acetyltransferase [Gemmatimonadaceae bacterium]
MSKYLIWGAGGHGKVVADTARASGLEVAGFIDLDRNRMGEVVEPGGAQLTHPEEDFLASIVRGSLPDGIDGIILAVGANTQRQRCRMLLPENFLKTVVHPRAIVSGHAYIGPGSVVMPGAIINSAAYVGSGVLVNTGAIVEHDCNIGNDSHIAPQSVLAGRVTVGERVLVGAGAVIIPYIKVGSDAMIGAGSVVIRDVSEGITVAGNPAKMVTK